MAGGLSRGRQNGCADDGSLKWFGELIARRGTLRTRILEREGLVRKIALRPTLTVLKFTGAAFLGLLLAGCSTKPEAQAPDPTKELQKIPAADTTKYQKPGAVKTWTNPYLVLRQDGVGLLDAADNMEKILKPDQVLGSLSQLPPSAWPDGRVVLVEDGPRPGSDKNALQKNKGVLQGILEQAHVAVVWLPS